MDWQDRIITDPKVLVGKPIIKGTRLSVEFIIDLLAQDLTREQILSSYPGLSHDDIAACLKYAGELLKSERVFALRNNRCACWQMKTSRAWRSKHFVRPAMMCFGFGPIDPAPKTLKFFDWRLTTSESF